MSGYRNTPSRMDQQECINGVRSHIATWRTAKSWHVRPEPTRLTPTLVPISFRSRAHRVDFGPIIPKRPWQRWPMRERSAPEIRQIPLRNRDTSVIPQAACIRGTETFETAGGRP